MLIWCLQGVCLLIPAAFFSGGAFSQSELVPYPGGGVLDHNSISHLPAGLANRPADKMLAERPVAGRTAQRN